MQGNKNENSNEKSSSEYIKHMRDTLFRYMEEQDLTVKELVDKSGIPLSTLNKFLYAEQSDCKLSNAIQLAKTLGISIDELVNAGTIDENVKRNMIICRKLPKNAIYLVRWFIQHQKTLYDQDKAISKKIISVQCPLYTNDGIIKVTNVFRQIDISSLSSDLKSKVFFGLHLNSDFYMPVYTSFDILLLANDRKPLAREHIVILIKDNLFIVKQKNVNGINQYFSIRNDRLICNESDADEVIGYVTYVVPDTSEDGTR